MERGKKTDSLDTMHKMPFALSRFDRVMILEEGLVINVRIYGRENVNFY